MAHICRVIVPILRNSCKECANGVLSFSTCSSVNANWRESGNPNKNGVLLNLPDFSYLDGSPTPYGSRQKLRILKQRQYTAKIIQLTEEIDLAQRLYQERMAAKEAEAADRIAKKLKPKGDKSVNEKLL